MQDFQSSMPPLPGRIFSATSSAIGSGPSSSGSRRMSSYPHQLQVQTPIKCPRCDSSNTKFCYYNNYNLSQPRHFCKSCRRYWTKGGVLRNVPVGGGCRKNSSKRCKTKPDKFAQTRQQQEQEPESTTTLTVAGSGSGSSSDSSSLNPNPEPIFSETDGSLTGLMAAAGVSGFGFPDPGFQTNNPEQAGLAGLDWPGAVEDPTTSIFDPAMYWGDADPSSLYLP